MNAKSIVESVFSVPVAKRLWTANIDSLLPVTPQNFSVAAVLPAVLYMFRWGQRRGRGQFQKAFGSSLAKPTIKDVSSVLSKKQSDFVNFDSSVKNSILGDLLLCYLLENKKHENGHDAEIARVFPTHYMSSWIDLPYTIAHLRFVPEMLVALLAQQPDEQFVRPSSSPTRFSVSRGFQDNHLLQIFGRGVSIEGQFASSQTSDKVDEGESFGIDQLLAIRLAQECGEAPGKLRGAGEVSQIPNSWSVARVAAEHLREDMSILLQAYGGLTPRQTLVPMLESVLGLGLLNVFLGCLSSALYWQKNGTIIPKDQQEPWPIFVDASNGADHSLRRLSEESLEEVGRMVDQVQSPLMAMRLLDAKGRLDPKLKSFLPKGPDNSTWLNLLGQVRMGRHERSEWINNDLHEKCEALALSLEEKDLFEDVVLLLRSETSTPDPVDRLADACCSLMGEKLLRTHHMKFLDSCLMVDSPHGLGRKRRVSMRNVSKYRTTGDVRSVVLPNTLLDALAHRHLCKAARGKSQRALPLIVFLQILRERYGLWVDEAPKNMAIGDEDLRRNRQILERRLRDLGLLVGVNDAESMKRLRPRYVTTPGL
ncbi:MAG: hypothetical protein H8K03_09290 [Nitrospira sp.]